MIEMLLGAIVGGAGFRIRGWSGFDKLTGRGATTARIVWGGVLALIALLGGLWWPLAPAVVLAGWLGCVPGWWGALEPKTPQQYALHALRGFVWVLPLAIIFEAAGALGGVVLLSGAVCGPAYWLGRKVKPALGTEIGEVLFGAAIGAAVIGAI